MYKNKKIIVVFPAYNAEKTLEKTFKEIPKEIVDEVILVDDFSKDKTIEVSKKLKITTIAHDKNKGYGANQKTCYKAALKRGADIVIMVHPDYQYDPKIIPDMIKPIAEKKADVVLASRFLHHKSPLKCGMPFYKYLGNIFLTFVENLILRTNLSEFHTGYRAWSKEALKKIPFEKNSNNFVFDTQIIIQTVSKKLTIKEMGVETRYFKEASSINLKDSIVYGLSIFRELGKFILTKWKIKKYKIYK